MDTIMLILRGTWLSTKVSSELFSQARQWELKFYEGPFEGRQ